jgi:hypothetical protein
VKTAYGKDLARFGPGFAEGDGEFILSNQTKEHAKSLQLKPTSPSLQSSFVSMPG